MTNRVIFLDVDGVLNHRARFTSDHKKGTHVLCPIACGLFASFVEQHDIKVVLSSTWRIFDDHVHLLRCAGVLDRGHDDWRTKDLRGNGARGWRGDEIAEWLSRHPEVEQYAIVDDDGDMLPEQMSRFVRTSFDSGLQIDHINRLSQALEIGA